MDQQDATDHHLELHLEDLEAEVDPPKLERVVANLLSNATRHAPPGTTVHVQLHREAGATLLAVEDHGPGIDPDYLDQVFDPFVQGPERHHDPQPGTGLGLTLAREFITLHGGTLTATNCPQGGARFEATLPGSDPTT